MPRIPTPLPPSLWSDGARRAAAVIAMLALAAIGFGVGYLVFDNGDEDATPAPTLIGSTSDHEDDASGFLIGGTRNTTRFAGVDPAATAAAIALATHPGDADRPNAVVLAPHDSWQLGLAASSLAAAPVGAPVLLSSADGMPDATATAIESLRPSGSGPDEGIQAYAVGGVATDDALETREFEGTDPAEAAAAIDEARKQSFGERDPEHLLVVSSEEPGYAMPAAAWAAHSGDSILFTGDSKLPEATAEALKRHPDTPVYVLGPEAAISKDVFKELKKLAPEVTRISGDEPVANSIAFAEFTDGSFGWDINDPGHGFTIASVEEPTSAAVAAPLAVLGKPGPLLLTTDSQAVPAALQTFLGATQPGYLDEPTRAIYNHVWIVGGPNVISETFQEQVDVLTNLVPIGDEPDVEGPERRDGPGAGAAKGSDD